MLPMAPASIDNNRHVQLTAIQIYPVKSMAGPSVARADVEPWGLRDDRRWVVLEPDGSRLSAREEHRMLGLSATPTGTGVELRSRDGQRTVVATPIDGELVPTSVSRLESVRLAADDAHDWLSRALDRPVRLAWLDDPRRRSVSEDHGGTSGDSLTLADAGPLLLTTTASLRQLNDWIPDDQSIEMARFRPNVVVDNVPEPFEEDRWRRDQDRCGNVSLHRDLRPLRADDTRPTNAPRRERTAANAREASPVGSQDVVRCASRSRQPRASSASVTTSRY